jgi:putative sigma-54 modulation protein
VQVKISIRHGHLSDKNQSVIRDKALKLLNVFDRLTMIEVTVDLNKTRDDQCHVEFVVQAEHRHDFVAQESHTDVIAAVDLALHKLQGQLRRYKEKIQDHRRTPSAGDVAGSARPEDSEE